MKVYDDILEIIQANKAIGNHFFDADTMRGFKSVILSRVYGGRYFITSERFESRTVVERRNYTVRECVDGVINTVSAFNKLTRYKAVKFATELGIENMKSLMPFQVTATLDTVGCYGTDEKGGVWASFTSGRYVICSYCGEATRSGYTLGKLGDEKYYCGRHVNYIVKEKIHA